MLSKFSKLPGIASLLPQQNTYSPKSVEQAVAAIKKAGKANTSNDDTLAAINTILSMMKRFTDSLQVQRVSCHALSNLAMQVVVARWIVQRGGFNMIKKALLRFETDHKLCWLASSAVWNMARPPNNRNVIGVEAVKLMIRTLQNHYNREKVANTAIGALSNLSLCPNLKPVIGTEANVQFIMQVIQRYSNKQSTQVMTSAAGLIANLAVSDEIAASLIKHNALPVVLTLFAWRKSVSSEPTLFRNTCAALNNMVTASGFLSVFLQSRGIEAVFTFLDKNNEQMFLSLLENCLLNIEVDIRERTTSFHLCAAHGKHDILKTLLESFPNFDLDEVDAKNMTCLDYAIAAKHKEIVLTLTKCGASKFQPRTLEACADEDREVMAKQIADGIEVLKSVRYCHNQALFHCMKEFPLYMCEVIGGFQNNVELLKSIKQF